MAKSVPARDFTVGWVCALPIELAAAAEMMDEEFADLPSHPTDSNLYSFGRIGVHKVVVACLPAGQKGANQAATVAGQMQLSFPSLWLRVLVGIGGGVPSLNDDIRLGDVVISQPAGQYGGVIQYDFGKTGVDGRIARTGSLNAPPDILLKALARLRANDHRGKLQVPTHLSKLSGILPKFASPGPDQDTLYDASSPHIGGATCAKCRPEDAVDRDARTTTDPVLFFGNIASGNQVMKDGPTRDRYSQELGGVLCFEMEAAGLMNNFPCIVIRGICDYTDAYKNKQWQPYAAATAAAYAKELLCIVPPLISGNLDRQEDSRPKLHFIVPFRRNEGFVGRDEILTQLLERILPSANRDACQRTAIVPAVNMVMFENAYREIGRALNIQGIEDDKADVKSLVKTALNQDDGSSWLLIVNNADDMELLFTSSKLMSHLPFNRKGFILLTTRNHQAAVRFYTRKGVIKLGELDDFEAAIRQASAYMAFNTNVTVSKYLRYCKSSNDQLVKLLSKDFDDQDRYEAIRNPVATTWLISFKHILRDKPLAAKYLGFICYLADKDIPTAVLPPGEEEMDRDEAIGTLIAYAFILRREALDRFDVHRLVRLVMRNWLREQEKEEGQPEHENREVWMAYLPHAQAALEVRGRCTDEEALWDLLSCTGEGNSLLGKYSEAEQMLRQTLELKEKLGPENPLTLGSMNNLAGVLNSQGKYDNSQGKYEEAEQMYRQTLELREKVLGPEHPSTLRTRDNLQALKAWIDSSSVASTD
ncbi:nucleoside phosphorylase domain-containing protein [Diplogelasinospora grovesii]|uniref:Nucleoside phosphorylase domain-containing protein n=1 Tax=Diplogelasinospora grovesii TaxID=303347 RepID=A0AAN6S8A7_9PEZI|nr:nucleoside phosphorylase domain-containing protein [Diplogelasinospora grovesii]